MHYCVQLSIYVQVITHIEFHTTEFWISDQVSNILSPSGNQIIQRNDVMPLPHQQLRQVANQMKSNATPEQLKKFAKWVVSEYGPLDTD